MISITQRIIKEGLRMGTQVAVIRKGAYGRCKNEFAQ